MKQKSNVRLTVAAIALTASLSVPVTLFSADTITYADQPESGFESLVGALNPDQEQSEKLRAILDDEATQSTPSRHATYQRILAVLSETQRSKYEALIQQRFDRRLQQMADALNLTQEQRAQLGAILMLADDRFAPSIGGSDLNEALRATLTDEQAQKLARLSPDHRRVGDLGR